MRYLTKKQLAVVEAASTDEKRYTLNSVRLEETETGLKATATDGRILVSVESPSEFKPEDFPVIEGFKDAPDTAKAALIPRTAFASLKKALPKEHRTLPILNNIAVKLSDEKSTFATTDLETSNVIPVRNVEGHFPAFEQIVDGTKQPAFEIAINPDHLITVLKIAMQVADRGQSVILGFNSSLEPMSVSVTSRGHKMYGVLMPMKAGRPLADKYKESLEKKSTKKDGK